MILDGVYQTVDQHASGKKARWTALLESPLPEEAADGAESVVVFRGVLCKPGEDGTVTGCTTTYNPNGEARRYVNSKGTLVFSQEFEVGYKGTFEMVRDVEFTGCSGYDPKTCAGRVYTDTSSLWTSACCATQGDSPGNPTVASKATGGLLGLINEMRLPLPNPKQMQCGATPSNPLFPPQTGMIKRTVLPIVIVLAILSCCLCCLCCYLKKVCCCKRKMSRPNADVELAKP